MHPSKERQKRHKMSPVAIWRAVSAHRTSPQPMERGKQERTRFMPLCQFRCAGMSKTHPSLLALMASSGCTRWSTDLSQTGSITNHRHASQS